MNKNVLKNGVIYCTTGESYFRDAVISAKSLKKSNPDVSICIFREEPNFNNEIFDIHLPLFDTIEEKEWVEQYYKKQPLKWMLKVIASHKSPFIRTIHLDADTFVTKTINELFHLLTKNDVFFTHLDWVKQVNGKNVGIHGLRVPDAVNSGVYGFTNSSAAKNLIGKKWREDCEKYNFEKNEQAIITLWIRNPEKYLNDVKWKIVDNVVYNATRRMWIVMDEYGFWEKAKILHFRETKYFNQLLNEEININDLLKLPYVNEIDRSDLKSKPNMLPLINSPNGLP